MKQLINKVGLTLIILSGSLVLSAQEQYNISLSDQPLKEALVQIENETGYQFYFSEDWLGATKVSGTYNNVSIETLLAEVLSSTSLQFVILNKQVVLTNNTPILTELQSEEDESNQYLFSREYEENANTVEIVGDRAEMKVGEESLLAGFVKDFSTGEPIIGAVVYTENPPKSTVTDARGFYTLSLPNGENELKARYTGMKLFKRKIILFSNF